MLNRFMRALLDCRERSILSAALLMVLCARGHGEDGTSIRWPDAPGRAKISNLFLAAPIEVGISSRTAGAIDSVTWEGKQFINANDHGRELQAAFAANSKRRECFNPTEAGSEADGTGVKSTSLLLSLNLFRSRLVSETQMAYWIGPDQQACRGVNPEAAGPLSKARLRKEVTIGAQGVPNAIEVKIDFLLANRLQLPGFEAPTGYMPAEFSRFWTYSPADDRLIEYSGNIDHQDLPLIFSVPDNEYAMGVYTPRRSDFQISYSGTRFTGKQMASPTVKWTCFFRTSEVSAGDHEFTSYILVGSLEKVRSGIRALCGKLESASCLAK
jgi:hypothetical protein